jgi:lipid-A-disaccharide synthase
MTAIFISAGDPSGDIAGSLLIKQLRLNSSELQISGLGGRRMKELGQEQLASGDQLAVLGFWEVAKKYYFFKRLMDNAISLIEREQPKAIVFIDYPGFNLRLAKRVRSFGIPIIYYISPQIWAWGGGRIKEIAQNIDLMLLILPFEAEIYERAGIRNQFVGHYLLDDIDAHLVKSPYNINSNLISLLPGSRPQEVERMLPVMLKTTELLAVQGKWRFVVAAMEGNIDYDRYMKKFKSSVDIVVEKTRELIAQSKLVITSSGTATLETGIIGRPMIVIYKTGWITYAIAKNLVKLDKIALINIAGGKKIVPELIQSSANPKNIAKEALQFLENAELSRKTTLELNSVTDRLGTCGASKLAADAIWEFIKC